MRALKPYTRRNPMKISVLGSIAATLLLSAFAISQSPPATVETPSDEATPAMPTTPVAETVEPELQLQPVPPILRLHLPLLGKQPGRELGVIVKSVAPDSEAEKAGLRTGDILLEAGGRLVIAGEPLDRMDSSQPIVVLRRGQARVLGPAAMNVPPVGPGRWGPRGWGPEQWDTVQGRLSVPLRVPRKRVPWRKVAPAGPGVSISSSAVTSGANGRAVSIGRAGDQVSLELSLPGLSNGPIRFQGTLEEIERELQVSDLSEAAKQEVRAALEQVR